MAFGGREDTVTELFPPPQLRTARRRWAARDMFVVADHRVDPVEVRSRAALRQAGCHAFAVRRVEFQTQRVLCSGS